MLTSGFFLLVTVLTYSFVPVLLNNYTRLMRHYAVTLMMAFFILAWAQLKTVTLINEFQGICVIMGKKGPNHLDLTGCIFFAIFRPLIKWLVF